MIDYNRVSKLIEKRCNHKNACNIPIDDIMTAEYKGSADTKNNGQCGDVAYFYIQAPCLFPSKDIVYRRIVGLSISCWAVFIYFFAIISFQYIQSV